MELYIIVFHKRYMPYLAFQKTVDKQKFINTSSDSWSYPQKIVLSLAEFRSSVKPEMFTAENTDR